MSEINPDQRSPKERDVENRMLEKVLSKLKSLWSSLSSWQRRMPYPFSTVIKVGGILGLAFSICFLRAIYYNSHGEEIICEVYDIRSGPYGKTIVYYEYFNPLGEFYMKANDAFFTGGENLNIHVGEKFHGKALKGGQVIMLDERIDSISMDEQMHRGVSWYHIVGFY